VTGHFSRDIPPAQTSTSARPHTCFPNFDVDAAFTRRGQLVQWRYFNGQLFLTSYDEKTDPVLLAVQSLGQSGAIGVR